MSGYNIASVVYVIWISKLKNFFPFFINVCFLFLFTMFSNDKDCFSSKQLVSLSYELAYKQNQKHLMLNEH